MFDNWATPVTSKPWGVVTVATAWIKRHSGYRLFVHVHHWAWERSHGDKTRPHPWASV